MSTSSSSAPGLRDRRLRSTSPGAARVCCSPTAPASRATRRAAAASRGARSGRHRATSRRSSSGSSTPSSCGSITAGASGVRAREPLILMTQRRRLDAYLAEQAVAAGATFRDGARVEQIEIGADERHRNGRRRDESSLTFSSAQTVPTGSSRGRPASTRESSAASRSRGTSPGSSSTTVATRPRP